MSAELAALRGSQYAKKGISTSASKERWNYWYSCLYGKSLSLYAQIIAFLSPLDATSRPEATPNAQAKITRS